MTWHVWIGFVAASAAMGLVPGPGVLSIVGCAVGSGRRVALAAVAGMAVGNAAAMTLSLAGVGAVLAASATLFSIVKWAGALYLIGLGVAMLAKGRPLPNEARPAPPDARVAFAGTVMVGTFHPKTIVFFVAFVPQFIGAGTGYAGQAVLLTITFCTVVACTDAGYALAASRAAHLLRGPKAALWSRRVGGSALVAAGVATAARG